jgi:nitronate monooxygenase
MRPLLHSLGVTIPVIQAPMANVSNPAMAAAVSEAGGLGSVSVGAGDAAAARDTLRAVRAATNRAVNVNVFCHRAPAADPAKEVTWVARLAPHFAQFGASPPRRLREIYRSFVNDDAMLAVLLEERPRVVSFHFGLPPRQRIDALKAAGIVLLSTATNADEARAAEAAGVDAVVAQGYEAGGHRGVFDPGAADEHLGTLSLTRLLASGLNVPVIAAGGVMDGAGVAAALALGAAAAQMGTAFVACAESSADAGFRAALLAPGARRTVMTRVISGRPGRCLVNRITGLADDVDVRDIPAYPIAYDAAKALNAAAKSAGEFGYGAHWAGQGAPLARSLPAAELVSQLGFEMRQHRAGMDLAGMNRPADAGGAADSSPRFA